MGNNSLCLSHSLKNHGRLDWYSSHTTYLIHFKLKQQGKLSLEILTKMLYTMENQEIQLLSGNCNTEKMHKFRTHGERCFDILRNPDFPFVLLVSARAISSVIFGTKCYIFYEGLQEAFICGSHL